MPPKRQNPRLKRRIYAKKGKVPAGPRRVNKPKQQQKTKTHKWKGLTIVPLPRAQRAHKGSSIPAGVGVSGKWPQTYIKAVKGQGQLNLKFCQVLCRVGCDASTNPGGGAISYSGATTKFAQILALGPGYSFNQPGTSVATIQHTSWASSAVAEMAEDYAMYRYKRIKFHYVPANATTASSRSYWAAWFDDPAIAVTGNASMATFSLAAMQQGSAVLFPAWQETAVFGKASPWKYVNQYIADGAQTGTGADLYIKVADYYNLHSVGAVAMAIDYTNASAGVIQDGYCFVEGEIELKDLIPRGDAEVAPTLGAVQRDSLGRLRYRVVPCQGFAQLAQRTNSHSPALAGVPSSHPGEMKTSEPATIQDLPASSRQALVQALKREAARLGSEFDAEIELVD